MRPILLTAAAASLALIPISRQIFWGPMAYAMMGGIIVGTVLTLLFLPALYVAWFRIKEPVPPPAAPGEPDSAATPARRALIIRSWPWPGAGDRIVILLAIAAKALAAPFIPASCDCHSTVMCAPR